MLRLRKTVVLRKGPWHLSSFTTVASNSTHHHVSTTFSENYKVDEQRKLTPKDIVCLLEKFVVGQEGAKKDIAIAFRERWRRSMLPEEIRNEVRSV
jgi:ATP-dependent protease Clp ATPase subunit